MILITGASSGLGAALAKCYLEDNQQVIISGRNKARLDAVTQGQGTHICAIDADLTSDISVSALFDQVGLLQAQSRLHTIIHCAGSGYFGAIENQNPAAISALLQNNIMSAIMLVREAVKRYRDQAVNVVVVMSTAAQVAKAGESTYCAAKWAVRGFIESVRLELKGSPMKIIAVYPGGMDTDFWATSGKTIDTSCFMSADEAANMLKQALVSSQHGYVADITINRA
ncbi:SDR family NAD(P)-dependent oxidoreductase [Shewanella holmiensis]|uniref:SDR family NAD(P)-dependent oxidoreductase n=1 Tax=Shewanella holmiensis TaxID=2952222 RepID=A0A9X3AXS5_9GAMM|nr:SDR family NAD(P)-dependent oxidoreductase [Shewanella holmiensis]MCT7943443.1 SDR family NAD(P)-dependent oxidoreductase [Shewanella holmiensis]